MERSQFLQVADEYKRKYGWLPIVVSKEEKRPRYSWDKYKSPTTPPTEQDYRDMIATETDITRNIGIITGKVSNVVVLDIDGEEGFQALREHGITELPTTLTATTGRGMHYYFKYTSNPALKTRAAYLPKVDIRADGGLIVTPPSMHKNGAQYKFIDPNAPILEFPQEIIDIFIKVQDDNLKKKKLDDVKGTPLRDRIHEGNRNDTFAKVVGALRSIGLDFETVLKAVKMENDILPDPLNDREVENIVESIMKRPMSAERYGTTEKSLVDRFVTMYGKTTKYDAVTGSWYIYNKERWAEDITEGNVLSRYYTMAKAIPHEIDRADFDSDEAFLATHEAYSKLSTSCESAAKVGNFFRLSKMTMGIGANFFDQDRHILNLKNGVFELDKHIFREHRASDYATKLGNVKYNPTSDCPTWERFLGEAFGGSKELIRFVQKAIGYSLTGSIKEQVFFILTGGGGNGKNVFLETLEYMLGDYAAVTAFETFTTHNDSGGAATPYAAALEGSRFVRASESNEGAYFNTGTLKKFVGDGTVSVRKLYGSAYVMNVSFKIWLATNSLPDVRDSSDGMWRRTRVIPFNFKPETPDPDLLSKLRDEMSGIFNWALEGYKMWETEGLGTCEEITVATQQYREETDIIGTFLGEVMERTTDINDRLKPGAIFSAYMQWCKASKYSPMGKIKFFKELETKKGLARIKSGESFYPMVKFSKSGGFEVGADSSVAVRTAHLEY